MRVAHTRENAIREAMRNFYAIKQKLARNAFLRAGIIGASVGVTAASVWVFVCTIMEKTVPWLYAIGGGVLLGLLVFGILLLCLYPFKRRIARKLDRELGNGEKVQTMIEFETSDEVMPALQRQDTEYKLAEELPATYTKFKNPWQCIAAGVLAIATFGAAAVSTISAMKQPDIPDDGGTSSDVIIDSTPFEIDDYQIAALYELIQYVKDSPMQDEPKAISVAALETLLDQVLAVTTRGEMVMAVQDAITAVDNAVEAVNTGTDLATALEKTGLASLRKLANAIGSTDMTRFNQQYAEFGQAFKTLEKAKETIETLAVNMEVALAMSEVDKNDGLYVALVNLKAILVAQVPELPNYEQTSWETQIDVLLAGATAPFSTALGKQISNDETRDYVIQKLQEIFGLRADEMPTISQDYKPTAGDGNDNDDTELGDGGLGTGDLNFANNELVYDPETGELKPYGEVFAKYYAIYTDAVSQGRIDPNLELILQQYFDNLSTNKDKK